jgi:hypothetical protein
MAATDVPLACNLKAISTSERPRYNDLVKWLRVAVQDRNERPDRYDYKLDTKKITLPEVAEWIKMERLCCPFLTFQLYVKARGTGFKNLNSGQMRSAEGSRASADSR